MLKAGHQPGWSVAGMGNEQRSEEKKGIDIRQTSNARLAWKKWTIGKDDDLMGGLKTRESIKHLRNNVRLKMVNNWQDGQQLTRLSLVLESREGFSNSERIAVSLNSAGNEKARDYQDMQFILNSETFSTFTNIVDRMANKIWGNTATVNLT